MANTTRTPDGVHSEPTQEEARQGQNIKGMVTVLVASLILVVVAYGVMLALFGGGETTDASPGADITSESSANPGLAPGAPPPAVNTSPQETAPSPN